ncbi:MAG: hypothetical protein ACQ9MH_14225 [Nitrospinales bacterium]
MNQLSKFKTILLTALQTVYEVRVELARALLLPLIIYIPLITINYSEGKTLLNWVHYILYLLVGILVAIPVHRLILIGPDSVSKWGFNKWTKRETQFLGFILGISLLGSIPSSLVPQIVGFITDESRVLVVGSFVGNLLFLWVWGRLSLVFPSTAIDGETSLRSSWLMTKNQQTLMFLVVGFFILCFYVLYQRRSQSVDATHLLKR